MYNLFIVFFFNDTATTEIYTLSLHDALPISHRAQGSDRRRGAAAAHPRGRPLYRPRGGGLQRHAPGHRDPVADRSEEHTSELQSRQYLVCRLLLEKKN